MDITLTEISLAYTERVCTIYNYYIEKTTATFHTEPVRQQDIPNIIPINNPRYKSFMILADGAICGYCYFAPFKNRQAFDRTAELSIYLSPDKTGKNIGTEVLALLEMEAARQNIAVLIAVVTAENKASIKLLEHSAYTKCAHYSKVGYKFGSWLDVVSYQKCIISD